MSLRCPVCGTNSLVPVLSAGPPGSRVLRQACRECERRRGAEGRERARQVGVVLAHLTIVAGIVLGVLTLSADYLGISGKPGFGWKQVVGAETGFLCIVLGLLLRRAMLGVGGLFVLALSLGADLLRVGHSPGLGWRKQLALLIAIALVALGGVAEGALRRRPPEGAPDRAGPEPTP
jgi:hypothetical protein